MFERFDGCVFCGVASVHNAECAAIRANVPVRARSVCGAVDLLPQSPRPIRKRALVDSPLVRDLFRRTRLDHGRGSGPLSPVPRSPPVVAAA